MKEWLVSLTESAIVLIDFIALLVIVYATAEAVITGTRQMIASPSTQEARGVWLRYARWLVAALTFQLAADIAETAITTSWEAVARIAAVAVIRTFLDFFLGRDLEDVRLRRNEAANRNEAAKV
jgi:uncharacterized membrane protein